MVARMFKYMHQKCACFVVHMSIRRHDTRYGNLAAYAHMRSCAHVYTHVYIRVHTHFYKYGYPHYYPHVHTSQCKCLYVYPCTWLCLYTNMPVHVYVDMSAQAPRSTLQRRRRCTLTGSGRQTPSPPTGTCALQKIVNDCE